MSSADTCRANGWGVGTCLAGEELGVTTVIVVTAVGEEAILARAIFHADAPTDSRETSWTLRYRDWREVRDPRTPA